MKVFAWICAGLMALAVIPAYADSGCSEKYENVSRFNPTELSDYQKCVHKFYGNEAGTVGSYIWMQHNNDFLYIHKDKLNGKTNVEVQDEVIATVLEHNLQTEIDRLNSKIAALEAANELLDNSDLQDEIDRLNGRIGKVKEKAAVVAANGHLIAGTLRTAHALNDDTTFDLTVGKATQAGPDAPLVFTKTLAEIDGHFSHTIHGMHWREVNALISIAREVATQAYNNGYDDGYADGYAAGYVAGYNQAVEDLK